MAKRLVQPVPGVVTGVFTRVGVPVLEGTRVVAVGSQQFTVPIDGVPAVEDGTEVTVVLDARGRPAAWEPPHRREAAALGVTPDVWRDFKAAHPAAAGPWGQILFADVFRLPVLVHENVLRMLGSSRTGPPYEKLGQYVAAGICTSDGDQVNRRREQIFRDPVLGAYLERFGWATAHLRLRHLYGLESGPAHRILKALDLSLDWLGLYPYLAAYAQNGHEIPFEALDAIAQYHQRTQSRPERLHAALLWTLHDHSLSGSRGLVLPVAKWLALADRTLKKHAGQTQSMAVSFLVALQKTAWPDLVATGYVGVWTDKKSGVQMAAVNALWHAVFYSGCYMRRLAAAPSGSPLVPPAAVPAAVRQGLDADQGAALDAVLRQRLTVITGGPGRGKTELIATLAVVAALQSPAVSTWVLAPTARAAVVSRNAALRVAARHGLAAGQLLAAVRFMTVHRALALTPTTLGAFPSRVVAPPLVMLDEASMVDALLLHALLDVLRESDSHVAVIGDTHQLPPVGVGQPLLDTLGLLASGPGGAPPSLVRTLTTMHRTAGNPLDAAVEDLRDAIDDARQPALLTLDPKAAQRARAQRYQQALDLLDQAATVDHRDAVITAARMAPKVRQAVVRAQKVGPSTFFVLGPYRIARVVNTGNLNQVLHDTLHRGPALAVGEPVIVRRNGYYPVASSPGQVYVTNGTPGEVVPGGDDRMFVARVDDPEASSGQRDVLLPKAGRGIDFDLAYVDTVHAAQGGEAPVVVLLGEPKDAAQDPAYRVAWSPRQLYTALTRVQDIGARQGRVVILGAITGEMLAATPDAVVAPQAFRSGWKKG